MPSPNVWGPPVWRLFHCMAEHIREEKFSEFKQPIFTIIKQICAFLPCPDCSKHATEFFRRVEISKIIKKQDFRNLLYIFHNMVNKRLRRPMFYVLHLNQYSKIPIYYALNIFLETFHTRGNMNLLTESFHRGMVVKNIRQFFQTYGKRLFSLPNTTTTSIPKEIKDNLEQKKDVVLEPGPGLSVFLEEEVGVVLEPGPGLSVFLEEKVDVVLEPGPGLSVFLEKEKVDVVLEPGHVEQQKVVVVLKEEEKEKTGVVVFVEPGHSSEDLKETEVSDVVVEPAHDKNQDKDKRKKREKKRKLMNGEKK